MPSDHRAVGVSIHNSHKQSRPARGRRIPTRQRRMHFESLEERRVLATGVFANVPEASNYTLVYELPIANTNNFTTTVPYTVNNAASITQPFDRIAYYLELQSGAGTLQYAYVSMDAFTTNVTKIGVPNVPSGEFYQQNVANMHVFSNAAGIVNGTTAPTIDGNIEFWPSNYNQSNAINIANANAATFDFGDGGAGTGQGYGSMQIHNHAAGAAQTVIAFNNWNGGTAGLGIGNNPAPVNGGVDWTFADNGATYTVKNMAILVHQVAPSPPVALPAPAALVANAAELANYQLVYRKDLATNTDISNSPANYNVDNSASIPIGSFDRVAYYLQLDGNWVEASFNAAGFTNNAAKTGIPNVASGEFYQQFVTSLNVASNVAGVVTGSGITTGNIEFWPSNYGGQNTLNVPGASAGNFDWGDGGANGANGHGSMQIHNYGASQTVMSVSAFGNGNTYGLGIGNKPGDANSDWTFAANAGSFTTKSLYVLVRPTTQTVSGTGSDDTIVLSKVGANYQYTLNGGGAIAVSGTNPLVFDSLVGNDSLTLDFSGGNPIPTGGLTFIGGPPTGAPGDNLVITNASGANAITSLAHTFYSGSDGKVTIDGGVVNYFGLERVDTASVVASNVTLNLNAGQNDQAVIEDDAAAGNSISQIRSTGGTFTTTQFPNAITSLTINANGGDAIALNAFDATFASSTAAINLSGISFTNTYTLGAANILPDAAAVSVTGPTTLNVAGFADTIGSLAGNGTLNNSGVATTLVIGGNNTSTTFSGVVQNTGSALALSKVGSGTLTLGGNNSYSGGTTVTQGTIATGTTTSLGSGAVNLSGGTLSLQAGGAFQQQTIPGLTGWNQDIIAEKTAATPAAGTTTDVLSWSFYEQGAPNSTQGLPSSGVATSLFGAGVNYQFQPYTGNNSVYLPANGSSTLTLTSPTKFQNLQFFNSAQGSNTTWNATLNFTDGTSTALANFVDPDWTASGQNAKTNTGLVPRANPWTGFYTNNLYIYEHDVTLAAADQVKTVQSITLNKTGGGPLMFFALSGMAQTAQTYANAINVTANSTIDVQGSPLATLGNLNLNGSKLAVTGIANSALTVGATTLSGNPTFDVAANTTLALGAVNDGGTARTITKQGLGTLSLGSAATSLIDGTQLNIAAGGVNSNNATALGTLAKVDIAPAAALNLGASQTIAQLSNTGTVNLNGFTLTTGANNQSYAFLGTIANGTPAGGSLVKAGTGTLTLGAATYTGATTINNGGTLQIGNGGAGGALQSSLITNNGTLIFNSSSNFAVGGNITGSGGVTQLGSGITTVSGVNTYLGPTSIVAGTLKLGVGGGGVGGVFSNVPEAANFKLLYSLAIGNNNDYTAAVPYSVNNSALFATGSFTRVGYYLELQPTAGSLQWVYASFDAAPFSNNPTKLGVPNVTSGEFYHYDAAGLLPGQVRNMNVVSNVPALVGANRTGVTTGNVEFWPSNYGGNNDWGVPGANSGTFDFGDGGSNTGDGHGSMQIHDYGLGKTLFGFNDWNNGGGAIGIGSQASGNPDWTFGTGVANYTIKNLQIVINASLPIPLLSPVTVNTGATLDLGGISPTINSLANGASGGGSVINSATTTPAALTINPASGSTSFSGVISDSGLAGAISLVKSGAGTQILAAANTYSGSTAIQNGTLRIGVDNALPIGTTLTLGGTSTSGIFDLAGKNQTLAGISNGGAGKVIDSDAATNTNALTLNIASGTQTIRSVLGDATNNTFSLQKNGGGTLIVGGANTYTGSTIINQGTVQLTGGLAPGAKIMPMGDSITDGTAVGTNAGYRGPLYSQLVAGGYSTQYVGSLTINPGSLPAGQQNHEGHSGWQTGDVASGILRGVKTVATGGYGWLAAAPDVILLHIGTNNTGLSEDQSIIDVGLTLDEIRNQRPTAITYVAQIIPKTGADAWIAEYKTELAALVAAKQALGYNVAIVDMNTNYPAGSLPDGVHPNDTGYNFMAHQWYTAIVSGGGTGGNVLPVGTAVSIANGATLDLNGVTQTVASLADIGASGGAVVNSNLTTPVTLTLSPASGSTSFSGTISDNSAANTISLSKSGAGTQILAGNNTYRGNTTISNGVLVAASNTALGSGAAGTTVNSGGTLGLSGNVTINGEALTLNGLGFTGQPGAIANVSGNNFIAASSPITAQVVSLGQIGIGSTLNTLTIDAAINLKSSALVIDGAGATTINGVVSGTGADVVGNFPENAGALSGVFTNVAEANGYVMAYEISNVTAGVNGAAAFPYTRNNTATIQPFNRIAYYLELQSAGGPLEYVYASMDAFTTNINQIGIPNGSTLYKWQQRVNNLNVASNRAGIATGTNLATGNIEIWPSNYGTGNDIGIPNANGGNYDFGDGGSDAGFGYGSFQIHNYDLDGAGAGTAGQVLLAYNNWRSGSGDLGIGNQVGGSGNPDYTFANNLPGYTVKRMAILVRETATRTILTNNALTKNGAGTLTLSNSSNAYNGTTTINAGILSVSDVANNGAVSGLGAGSVVNINGNSVLQFNAGTDATNRTINLGGTSGANSPRIEVLNGDLQLAGATINGAGQNLGKLGAGTLTLDTGTSATLGNLYVAGGNLTLRSNSTTNVSGVTAIGANSFFINNGTSLAGAGTLNVQNTAVLNTATMNVGENNGGAAQTNTINQSGGTVNVTSNSGENAAIRLGHWPNTTNTYNLSGGALNITQADMDIAIGTDGTGIFNQTGGTATSPGVMVNHRNAGGSGTFTLTGGTFNLGTRGFQTAGGTANLNLGGSGGTLRATGSFASSVPAVLSGTGASAINIDTNGQTVTWNANLTGAGGLNKLGTGTLLLNGAASTYSGTTAVSAGTLGGSGNNTSAVNLANVATLSPGGTPGALGVGTTTFVAGSIFRVELNGPTAGTGYDQLRVIGSVNLANATLNATTTVTPALGQIYRLIDNDGSDATNGTFAGLAEGTIVTIGGLRYYITYNDPTGRFGTGNDVALIRNNTVTAVADNFPAINEDTPLAANVKTNDTDLDRDGTVQIVSGPTSGSFTSFDFATGAFTYQPTANFSGTDSFTYRLFDGEFTSSTVTATITITPVADQPNLTVPAAVVTGLENTPIPLPITASLVDTDGSETLSIVISNVPSLVTLSAGTPSSSDSTLANRSYTLTPAQLVGLTLRRPENLATFTLQVDATARETATGALSAPRSASFAVRIDNAAPTPHLDSVLLAGAPLATIPSTITAAPGSSVSFVVSATDLAPDPFDAPFTFTLTWGNGTITQVQTTPGLVAQNVPLTFTYDFAGLPTGLYQPTLSVVDNDGSPAGTLLLPAIQLATAVTVEGVLYVGGTAGSDRIILQTGTGGISVRINNLLVGNFSASRKIVVYGNDGSDTITSSALLPVEIYGGAGDDYLTGGNSADTLDGGDGRDRLLGGNGNDMLLGGPGDDTLTGGSGNDYLSGDEQLDPLGGTLLPDGSLSQPGDIIDTGAEGRDTLSGDAGNDTLLGGAGMDTLNGGVGNDYLRGDAGGDKLDGGDGHDLLLGGAGGDTLYGRAGRDILIGGDGLDSLLGSTSADLLSAGDLDAAFAADDTQLLTLWQLWSTSQAQPAFDLLAANSVDDHLGDTLHGEADVDWYLLFALDYISATAELKGNKIFTL